MSYSKIFKDVKNRNFHEYIVSYNKNKSIIHFKKNHNFLLLYYLVEIKQIELSDEFKKKYKDELISAKFRFEDELEIYNKI
jgi:hypothetical protein